LAYLSHSTGVRCAFSTGIYARGCRWVPTPARFKQTSRRVTNGIRLGCPLFLPVHTANSVQTLKVLTMTSMHTSQTLPHHKFRPNTEGARQIIMRLHSPFSTKRASGTGVLADGTGLPLNHLWELTGRIQAGLGHSASGTKVPLVPL
jgi:hypothetical protein